MVEVNLGNQISKVLKETRLLLSLAFDNELKSHLDQVKVYIDE